MKADFDGELKRRMEEAALLPSDHPMRREVRALISTHGEGAQQEWIELQQESEQLHVELQQITPPPGLEDRLLRIPDSAQRRSRVWKKSIAAVAAVFVLLTTVVMSIVMRPGAVSFDQSIGHVAALVAEDHSAHPQLTVLTSSPQQVIEELQPNAPFPVHLTTTPGAAALIGGRICSFDEGPLIYTRWKSAKGDISMYQLRLGDFGLPANLPPREVRQEQTDHRGRCRVRLWSDDQFAYAIVVDDDSTDTGS